jgi:hypothetical protein
VTARSYAEFWNHRLFPPETDHAEVGRWLRAQAKTGFVRELSESTFQYRNRCTCGVNLPVCPNSVSLILTRDFVPTEPSHWHFSICCVTSSGYRGYQKSEGDHWADLIFGPYRNRVIDGGALTGVGQEKDVHHFRLDCDWSDRADPAVTLEGLDLAV